MRADQQMPGPARAARRPDAGPADQAGQADQADQADQAGQADKADQAGQADQASQRRVWEPPFPVNVALVLGVHRRGSGDPAYRVDAAGAIWRTTRTPDGPATLRVISAASGPDHLGRDGTAPDRAGPDGTAPDRAGPDRAGPAHPGPAHPGPAHPGPAHPGPPRTGPAGAALRITGTAWGPGAGWVLDRLPDLLGARDDPAAFRPEHPRLRDLAARYPGLRLGRTGRVLEALVPAVLEQKVVGKEATRAWRLLLTWYGVPAPGPAPAGMRVVPPAATWAAIPSWDWHRAGVEGVRAATITGAARVADSLERICAVPGPRADQMLRSLPGIGPWTSAEVRQRACGDPDAVSVGDYHLPAQVGWALAGEATDDEGMLALLAPYAGQRHRAARLIEIGRVGPPRRGPRNSIRDYRAI
jgi:3-methyladenine DNA glycosylase/8-oxoguanine DNA glycosylase